ncbi:MAG: sugar ABC transporter substrate-binding protein, partial [Oscillospiraceae bacterium]|nr:sugar ABC transporter substrate-binding protein [Oscillospiraceae bacterium]
MKKVLSILLVLAMLLSLAACASTPTETPEGEVAPEKTEDTTGEVVEIVWAMQGAANETEGWMAVVNTANEILKDKNIKIVVQNIPTSSWDEYYQKVTAQIAGGNCPDIGRIAESLMPTVIKKNQVVELTDRIAADIDTSAYFDTCFDNAGNQNGKIYGLPSGVYHKILYYNKDMFDAANLEYPSADWEDSLTMEELVEVSKALSSGEGANRIYGYSGACDIFNVGKQAGKYLYSSDNTYVIDDSHRQVYSYLDQMLNVDKSMPTPVETQIMGGFDMFCSGKVAMCEEGTWSHQTARAITDFEVGIAACPAIDGKGSAVAFLDNYVIWSGTEHPEEAWEALKAIFSEECFNALAE